MRSLMSCLRLMIAAIGLLNGASLAAEFSLKSLTPMPREKSRTAALTISRPGWKLFQAVARRLRTSTTANSAPSSR